MERAHRVRRDDGFRHLAGNCINFGFERRAAGADYRWYGMERGDPPERPRVVFQVTLDGWGDFEREGESRRVDASRAFFAVFPSEHVYRLPPESPGWTFFWFNFGHPYVVRRLIELGARHAAVLEIAPDSKLMTQSLGLFEQLCRQRLEDSFAEEAALFAWLFEFERHLHDLAHPRTERAAWLEAARRYTLEHLDESFGVDELATDRGVSRGHYSHRFQAATGLTPAAWVLEIRLAEARRRLRESAAPLKDIAADTGFADANHLCKAFRRHFHLSPGTYRRQLR